MSCSPEPQTRRAVLAGAAVATAAAPFACSVNAALVQVSSGHSHDWDWMIGHWAVRHRKLKHRLIGDREWVEFDGTTRFWPTLGGLGNIDDNYLNDPSGAYRAISLRAYDPSAGHWLIWWQDSRSPSELGIPVAGNFTNGAGLFLADDVLDGQPIKVKFVWSNTTSTAPTWEQAYSADGGKTWEVNWRMDFARSSA